MSVEWKIHGRKRTQRKRVRRMLRCFCAIYPWAFNSQVHNNNNNASITRPSTYMAISYMLYNSTGPLPIYTCNKFWCRNTKGPSPYWLLVHHSIYNLLIHEVRPPIHSLIPNYIIIIFLRYIVTHSAVHDHDNHAYLHMHVFSLSPFVCLPITWLSNYWNLNIYVLYE